MSKPFPKELYERLAAWMADNEDSCLLEEQMPKKDVEPYLIDEAMEIFYELYHIWNDND
jgi:hypothetical protein